MQTGMGRGGGCIWAKLPQSICPVCLLVIKLPTRHQQLEPLREAEINQESPCGNAAHLRWDQPHHELPASGNKGESSPVSNEWHRKVGKCCCREEGICKARNCQERLQTHTAQRSLISSTQPEHWKLRFCPSTNADEIFSEGQWCWYVNINSTIQLTKPQLIYK